MVLMLTMGIGNDLAAQPISKRQYVQAKEQLEQLENKLKWQLVSLKIASLMRSQHPLMIKLVSREKKEVAELESEIAHYKKNILAWENKYQRKIIPVTKGCIQNEVRPFSRKLLHILRSGREIVAKMNWDATPEAPAQSQLIAVKQSTIHYLNQTAYLVLFKGKEIIKIFKFKKVGNGELATSRTTLVKNGIHITYQEGNAISATGYVAQLAYLEEVPLTKDILLKLGPAVSYQVGDKQKHGAFRKGSMAVMGPQFQLHINAKYFIGLNTGMGIRFKTSWIRDLMQNQSQGVERAGEIMFHFGMVFPG